MCFGEIRKTWIEKKREKPSTKPNQKLEIKDRKSESLARYIKRGQSALQTVIIVYVCMYSAKNKVNSFVINLFEEIINSSK